MKKIYRIRTGLHEFRSTRADEVVTRLAGTAEDGEAEESLEGRR